MSLELNISKELLFEKRINPYKDENITELTVINFANYFKFVAKSMPKDWSK